MVRECEEAEREEWWVFVRPGLCFHFSVRNAVSGCAGTRGARFPYVIAGWARPAPGARSGPHARRLNAPLSFS